MNDLQHNIHVLNSEVETYKTANGELAYERDIYLSSVKGLRDVNDSLYAEIQNLKRDIDNAVVSEIIIHDTLHSEQTVYITQDLDTSFSFTFDDSWLRANHNLTLHNSTLKSESFEYTMSMNVGVYFSEDNTVILMSFSVMYSDSVIITNHHVHIIGELVFNSDLELFILTRL